MSNASPTKHSVTLLQRLSVKRIIAIILILALTPLCVLYCISYYFNQSIGAPLPFASSDHQQQASNADEKSQSVLHILAAKSLQQALPPIVERFARHHPDIDVKVRYIDPSQLKQIKKTSDHRIDLLLMPTEMSSEAKPLFNVASSPIPTPSVQDVEELTEEVKTVAKTQTVATNSSINNHQADRHNKPTPNSLHYWQQFDFALRGQTLYQSHLLNDQQASVLFSRFLLTSNSQDDFTKAGLQSIELFHSRMDDDVDAKKILSSNAVIDSHNLVTTDTN